MTETSTLSIPKQLARLKVGDRFTYPGLNRTNVYQDAKKLGIKVSTKLDLQNRCVEVTRKS